MEIYESCDQVGCIIDICVRIEYMTRTQFLWTI